MGAIRQGFLPPTKAVDLKQLSIGNSGTDGSGTVVTLKAAGTNGSDVYGCDIFAPGTVTAGKIRFYLTDGIVTYCVGEILVTATTPSASVPGFSTQWVPPNGTLSMPTGWTLKAAPLNSETFNITVRSSDY